MVPTAEQVRRYQADAATAAARQLCADRRCSQRALGMQIHKGGLCAGPSTVTEALSLRGRRAPGIYGQDLFEVDGEAV
jgi:hypothetical protein